MLMLIVVHTLLRKVMILMLRPHHDGDIWTNDTAPQSGHPLPMVNRSVGVCDGEMGGEGIG